MAEYFKIFFIELGSYFDYLLEKNFLDLSNFCISANLTGLVSYVPTHNMDCTKKISPKFHQNFKKLKKWIWLLVELVSTFRRSGGINNHKVKKVIQTVDSMNKKYDHCNDLHPWYNLFRDARVIMMYGLFFTFLTFLFFETKWFQNNPV